MSHGRALIVGMTEPSSWIESVARAAEAQGGSLSRRQLAEAGVADRTISRMLETGRLVELYPRVYRFGGSPLGWEERVRAATRWGGQDAVASQRCAARLLGLSIRSEVIEITTPRKARPPEGSPCTADGSIRSIGAWCAAFQPPRLHGLFFLTIGAVVPASLVEKLMDEGLISGRVKMAEMVDVLMREGRRGVRGVSTFRNLLAKRIDLPETIMTKLEHRLSTIFAEYRLPPAVAQFDVMLGERRLVIDFAYPDRKIAIEGDGHQFHLSRRDRERDLERQNLLLIEGWLVLRYTWEKVTKHRREVADSIYAALQSRTAP